MQNSHPWILKLAKAQHFIANYLHNGYKSLLRNKKKHNERSSQMQAAQERIAFQRQPDNKIYAVKTPLVLKEVRNENTEKNHNRD